MINARHRQNFRKFVDFKGELTISSNILVLTYFVYYSKPNTSVKTANSYCIPLTRYEHLKNPGDDVITGVAVNMQNDL